MNYEVVNVTVPYHGKIIEVHVDDIEYTESKRKSKREVVVKRDFAMVVPVSASGELLCVKQFRHPFKEMALSFPAGNVDGSESPETAARRELEEEAGLRAASLVKLAELREVPEFARSVGHLYVATGLEEVETRREDGEATMTTQWLQEADLRRMVRRGELQSTTVVAALHHALDYLGRSRLSSQQGPSQGWRSACPLHWPVREQLLLGLAVVTFAAGRYARR